MLAYSSLACGAHGVDGVPGFLCGQCGVQKLRSDERLAITRMALPVTLSKSWTTCWLFTLCRLVHVSVRFALVLARLVP